MESFRPTARPGRLRGLWLAMTIALAASGCSTATAPGPPPSTVPLSSLTIAPRTDTLRVGNGRQFTATALDTLGAVVSHPALTWSTSDAAVITVSTGGFVTSRSEGSAFVYVDGNGRRDSATVYCFPDTGWYLQPAAAAGSNLYGVFFRPDGRSGWAVGSNGKIVHTANSGESWLAQASRTLFTVRGVWFTSDDDGWAVGDAGTVLQTNDGGVTWTRILTVGTSENLRDVQFESATLGWACGTNGTIVRTTDGGATWERTKLPITFALNSISFVGTHGWTVGDGGVLYGSDDSGATWYPVALSTSQSLRSVRRLDFDHALAVGQLGTVALATPDGFGGVAWSLPLPNAGASNQLEGVTLVDALTGFAVGYNSAVGGVILRTDDGGLDWSAQSSRSFSRLNDVYFVDALRGWAVGDAGVIVHTATGGLPR